MRTFVKICSLLSILLIFTQCEKERISNDCAIKGTIYAPGLSSDVFQVSFQNLDNLDEVHVVSASEDETFYVENLYLTRYRVGATRNGYKLQTVVRKDLGSTTLTDFIIDFSKGKNAEITIIMQKADGMEEYCDVSVLDLDDNSLSAFYIKKTASIFEFKLRSKFTSGLVLSEFNISSDCRLKYGNKSIPLFSLITPQKGMTNYVLDTEVILYINPEIQKYINEPGVTLINPTITIGKGLELPIHLYD